MTEDEAKTKWCPMTESKLVGDDDKCIASGCMWWIWGTSPRDAQEINARGDAGAFPSGRCGAIK